VVNTRCKKRRTRVHLGIRERTIQSSPNSSPSEQNEVRADRPTRCTGRRTPRIRFGNGTTGFRQETTSKYGAGSATSVRQVAARGPGLGVNCINKILRHHINRWSWTLPAEQPRKQISPDRYGLFHQVDGSLRSSHQKASIVAEALVTNFFCRFGIPGLLHSDQGRNIVSRILQDILQRLGVNRKRTTLPHTQ
jgi:hypothetical protein